MLRVDDLVADYGAGPVLHGVSLAVPSGSVVALVGPNGAGKTTLIRSISGLLTPTGGTISVDEEPLSGLEPSARVARGVCHVPEGRGIFHSLSVRENLELFALDADGHARVDLALTAFPRLSERASQVAGTLSGGEQQMLALSRAIVQHPEHVLVDEVSMGLGPMVVDALYEFLGGLAAAGCGLLIVEQFVHRALAAADYLYVLAQGEVAFAGEPPEVTEAEIFELYLGVPNLS